jgi:S-adenosylmethionine hydrolase
VGTDRKLIYVEAGRWRYLLPDNGLIGLVAAQWPVQRVVQLTQSRFWAPNVSATFHGRDIIAHVAGHLLQGVDPLEFGELTQDLVELPFERSSSSARSLCGWIAFIDRFGNALTSIAKADLVQFCTTHQIEIGGTSVKIQGIQQNPIWSSTYGNHAPGTCVAIFDSQDRLEIAMVNGNAARSLELKVGQLVEVAIATESC